MKRRQKAFFILSFIFLAALFVGIAVHRTLERNIAEAQHDEEILAVIARRARETQTDALIIWHDGKIIYEYSTPDAPQLFQVMSITKSIVSLAIGCLIADGKLESIDMPVYKIYPEWHQGRKKEITIRHLLNHTSGLQEQKDVFAETWPAPDVIKLALAAELTSDPGVTYFYNNKATNLLAGIIQKLSGMPLDAYAKQELLEPLGITDMVWEHDDAGNPYAMAGLKIGPQDLLKIGELILNNGVYNGGQIIDTTWLETAFKPSQTFRTDLGLLWWLARFKGSPEIVGYIAQGYLGQYLAIFPHKRLIALRLISYKDLYQQPDWGQKVEFKDFLDLVYEL